MRDPVTAQTVHSEGSSPQPWKVKDVSHTEQSMMTRVTFRINLTKPSKGIEKRILVKLVNLLARKLLVVRRILVVLHNEHGR